MVKVLEELLAGDVVKWVQLVTREDAQKAENLQLCGDVQRIPWRYLEHPRGNTCVDN